MYGMRSSMYEEVLVSSMAFAMTVVATKKATPLIDGVEGQQTSEKSSRRHLPP